MSKNTKYLLLLSIYLTVNLTMTAQVKNLPKDSTVRIGILPNGLTYYIKNNTEEKGLANFYIAQKVGSMQEDDSQRGLAHFLEHMCFNGTSHFPNNRLIEYLESIGVKFGTNLNAYTSFDQTVYNIDNVPVTVHGSLDSCLTILYDWSSSLALDSVEIDKERGVIHEEWRTRRSPSMRMYDNVLPILLKDSKYAYRMPIGLMSIVDSFPYKALRDYYHKWYRPDLQGIIVVGDVNVDEVESKIKTLFGNVSKKKNEAERIYYNVPDNQEPLIAIAKDKEQKQLQCMISFKHNIYPDNQKNTEEYYQSGLEKSFAASILNNRLTELLHQANPPFLSAKTSDENYLVAKTKDAFTVSFSSTNEGFKTAFNAVMAELERVKRFGTTQSEFDRVEEDYRSSLDNFYLERYKIKNKSFVNDYLQNFLENSSIMSREQEYKLNNQLLPRITVQDINKRYIQWLKDTTNISVLVFSPDKNSVVIPQEKEINYFLRESRHLDVEPYVDTTPKGDLMNFAPQSGKISKEKKGKFGSTIWILSNGAKVVFKPTQFKENQIKMMAISPGGTSLYSDKEMVNLEMVGNVASVGGVGDYDAVQLGKLLSGKNVNVRSTVATLREGIVGYSSPKDMETMLQLMYLRFTAPRKDSVAYVSFLSRLKTQLEGQKKDPANDYSDSIQVAMYNHHPRAFSMTPESLKQLDYDRCIQIYKERFANSADFTFYFVGNIDFEKFKPLILKYIASLPSKNVREKYVDRNKDIREGIYINNFTKKMETPKALVTLFYNIAEKTTLKEELEIDILTQILRMIYTDEIREKEGGTYGVSVKGGVSRDPKEKLFMQVSFSTNPESRDKLSDLAQQLFKKVAKDGASAEMIEKIRKYMVKKHNEDIKDNAYWMDVLTTYYWENEDVDSLYEKILNKISAKDIQNLADRFIKSGNLIEVSMSGVN